MAYSNWGAFVYCEGERRQDKEDAPAFEEIEVKSWADKCHGVLGDGDVRVRCYKNYAPVIFERHSDGTITEVAYRDEDEFDPWEFHVDFKYKGYRFEFHESGTYRPCSALMVEPDGTRWECNYGYMYGAGWMD